MYCLNSVFATFYQQSKEEAFPCSRRRCFWVHEETNILHSGFIFIGCEDWGRVERSGGNTAYNYFRNVVGARGVYFMLLIFVGGG